MNPLLVRVGRHLTHFVLPDFYTHLPVVRHWFSGSFRNLNSSTSAFSPTPLLIQATLLALLFGEGLSHHPSP